VCLWIVCSAHGGEPVAWGETVRPGRAVWIRVLRVGPERWLSVRTEFARDAPSRLVVAGSGDRCRAWTDLAVVAEAGRNLDNGLLFQVPNGPLLLACRSVAVDRSSGRLRVLRGTGDGKTWTPHGVIDASEVAPGEIFGRGLWEPWLYTLPDGRLAAAYADERHSRESPAFSQVCSIRVSSDAGATWGGEHVLAAEPGGAKLRPGMPIVIRRKDGRYLAVYEIVGIFGTPVYMKESVDGLNWPEGIGTPIDGHRAGPYVLELGDSRLSLTSCTNRLSWSDDGGRTWTMARERCWLPERSPERTWLTWPALYDLGGGEIMLTTSSIRSTPYELRFGNLARRGATAPRK
jgi:hypothetical protein